MKQLDVISILYMVNLYFFFAKWKKISCAKALHYDSKNHIALSRRAAAEYQTEHFLMVLFELLDNVIHKIS